MEDEFQFGPDSAEGTTNGTTTKETGNSDMLKHAVSKTSRNDSLRSSQGSRSSGRSQGQGLSNSIVLPQRFVVKYLGVRETANLWGVKNTRGPVEEMVGAAKRVMSTSKNTLPLLNLEVTPEGITVSPMPQNVNPNYLQGRFPIEAISYGVQDLVYTRVFAMIVVKPTVDSNGTVTNSMPKLSQMNATSSGNPQPPFRCHAFVTESQEVTKNLTYALSEAFQSFSKKVTGEGKVMPKRITIDLSLGQDVTADEMDSEA